MSFFATGMDVPFTPQPPVIDGLNNDAQWQQSKWQSLKYLNVGTLPDQSDFSGRFRLLWDNDHLYLQAEIIDDVLLDIHPDPLESYWDDDCLEIFVDEDGSGGIHQYNHNAFAYHIALDNQAVDIGDDKKPHLYNEHMTSRWQRSPEAPHKIIWEVSMSLYPGTYRDDKPVPPVKLNADKTIGFMLAYCDNDSSENREHFMASVDVEPVDGDKNRGWIDASVFGKITLVDGNER